MVEYISSHAFYEHYSLYEVDLGNVEMIGKSAFSDSALTPIVLPDTVESIGRYTFAYLGAMIIDSGVGFLDVGVFVGCDLLTEVYNFSVLDIKLGEYGIPESATVICE